MKKIRFIFVQFLASMFMLSSCSFLDVVPQGTLDESQVKDPSQIDALGISESSAFVNDHYDKPFSLWPYGNVRSDDSDKGGNAHDDLAAFMSSEIT